MHPAQSAASALDYCIVADMPFHDTAWLIGGGIKIDIPAPDRCAALDHTPVAGYQLLIRGIPKHEAAVADDTRPRPPNRQCAHGRARQVSTLNESGFAHDWLEHCYPARS